VPVGSGDYVSMLVRDGPEEAGQDQEAASSEEASFLMVSNPEFLREDSTVYDSLFPERIVAAADSREAPETSTNRVRSLTLQPHLVVEHKPP
jgi:UDPglucose 6-dehydrogenase